MYTSAIRKTCNTSFLRFREYLVCVVFKVPPGPPGNQGPEGPPGEGSGFLGIPESLDRRGPKGYRVSGLSALCIEYVYKNLKKDSFGISRGLLKPNF